MSTIEAVWRYIDCPIEPLFMTNSVGPLERLLDGVPGKAGNISIIREAGALPPSPRQKSSLLCSGSQGLYYHYYHQVN